MGHIDPDTLKMLREQRGLSQEALAEAIDVTTKTINRLERGRVKKPHGETLRKLAEVLDTSIEDLATPPDDEPDTDSGWLGSKRSYFFTTYDDRMHYRFIEARYGVKVNSILKAAPLLFVLVAEMSLAERRKRLEATEDALSKVPSDGVAHLENARIGAFRIEEAAWVERASIEACDLSGKRFRDDEWSEDYHGDRDLFVDFLRRTAQAVCPETILWNEDDILGPFEALHAELFNAEISRLANGNQEAANALRSGDIHPKDIPPELLSDDQAEARAEWLADHCGEDTRTYESDSKEHFDTHFAHLLPSFAKQKSEEGKK